MIAISGIREKWIKLKTLYPLVWPHDPHLKICFVLTFVLFIATCLLNVYTPIYDKYIVDSVTSTGDQPAIFRWDLVCIYVLLRYLTCINNLQEVFWTKIEENIRQVFEITVFSHIHSLSIRWHMNRKTGEILEVMRNSSYNITSLLNLVFFQAFRIIFENTFTIIYFSLIYDVWFGLTIVFSAICYAGLRIFENQYMSKLRKKKNDADYETRNRSMDSLLNFETVKYFGNERYEVKCFKEVTSVLHKGVLTRSIMRFFFNCGTTLIIDSSFLITNLMCLYKVVTTKELTLGEYIMFSKSFFNIYSSVDWLTYIFKAVRDDLIDMEKLFDLLQEQPEIRDSPDAKELEKYEGSIQFKNVFFAYNPKEPLLKNISFSVSPGETVALVGPSGSGKTTILRLLLRFYEVNSGSITIDGQNIKDVTQESLRKSIGVVPQDTVLFNTTIRFNIQYGNFSADEDAIVEAAKGAEMHDKILSFENGYDTKVGERGLRLSGGEKQRVSIARVLLRAPQIVVLDEATSSLDSQTEKNIQESLNRVCSKKTTLIVAHRLSTVIHADQILVLKEGIIVERGRHQELLDKNGVYASMWHKQFSTIKENDIKE